MANYLPVLLVSVSAGIPDDASFQPLPHGQVDYLSHNWQEEDVWRSWRNMTKQKNEIANGVRLENASWRTWWKQRNNLKTISPETLNWLKDSDVTWLYGPLHTAAEWCPPKPCPVPNSLSSPSSSAALDLSTREYPSSHDPLPAKKPILKHRSISEMLTSALPPSPLFEPMDVDEFYGPDDDDDVRLGDYTFGCGNVSESSCGSGTSSASASPRPGLLRIKSDTNILRRFGRTASSYRKKSPPPRIIAQPEPQEALSNSARTTSSSNLAEMLTQQPHPDLHPHSRLHAHLHSHLQGQSSSSSSSPALHTQSSGSGVGGRSDSSDTTASSRSDAEMSSVALPPKKHISFNTFVEQCIAIEKPKGRLGTTCMNSWDEEQVHEQVYNYDADDGYDEDEEDGLYEETQSQSDSEDEVLEMRSSSRRSSTSSNADVRTFRMLSANQDMHGHHHRPPLRRTSTSKSTASRSSGASDKEHVTIAPIAPTILKTSGRGTGVTGGTSERVDVSALLGYAYAQGHGYAFKASCEEEGGAAGESGELVYQPPEGSIYSVVRDMNGVSVNGGGPSASLDGAGVDPPWQHRFLSPPVVSSPSCDEGAEENGFDYFHGPDLGEDFAQRTEPLNAMRWKGEVNRDSPFGVFGNGRERTSSPSPDYTQPPSNPRIALIRSESSRRPNGSGSADVDVTPTQSAMSTPTVVIRTPGTSTASQDQYPNSASPSPHESKLPSLGLATRARMLSPPDSTSKSSSPQRGRPVSTSPVSPVLGSGYVTSGSATSSAFSSGGESRGRSRTPGSSTSASDLEQCERGRSRSRSSGGTGSPLGSVSPHSVRPAVVSGVYGGCGYGTGHSGREIRDGKGVRLYRKTSEDFVTRDERGREREREGERRVSESLSPPIQASARVNGAVSGACGSVDVTNGIRRTHAPTPQSGLYQSYAVNSFGKRRHDISPPSSTSTPAPNGVSMGLQRPTVVVNGTDAGAVNSAGPSGIPVIIEEDEQRSSNPTPANSPEPKPPPPLPLPPPSQSRMNTNGTKASSPNHSLPLSAQPVSATAPGKSTLLHVQRPLASASSGADAQDEPGSPTLAVRAAEIVSSARGLLGVIWNGAV